MMKINKKDYLFLAIKNDLPLKRKWILFTFSILLTNNDFFRITNDGLIGIINNEEYLITDWNKDKPLFYPTDEVKIDKGFLSIVKENMNTTVGRLILNYIYFERQLSGKIPYHNESMFTIGDIVNNEIVPKVKNDKDVKSPDDISLKEFKQLIYAILMIRSLSKIFVVAATEKTMTPAPGIQEYKKKLDKEYKTKYGEDYIKDQVLALEVEKKLLDYDAKYLEDDPTNNITSDKKIKGTSRKELYIAMGHMQSIVPKPEIPYIKRSLSEGYPEDPEELAAIINNIRYGSSARGEETKDTGLIAKYLIRAVRFFKIIPNHDCGTKLGVDIEINKYNFKFLIGSYYIVNNKPVRIDIKDEHLIGKTITLRDTMYCKTKGDRHCSICAGDTLSRNPNSPSGVAMEIGGKALSLSLSKFHSKQQMLIEVTKDDVFE